MWRSTDFLRRVVGDIEERGEITLTNICEHRRVLLAEDFLWWATANHGERTITHGTSDRWLRSVQ